MGRGREKTGKGAPDRGVVSLLPSRRLVHRKNERLVALQVQVQPADGVRGARAARNGCGERTQR